MNEGAMAAIAGTADLPVAESSPPRSSRSRVGAAAVLVSILVGFVSAWFWLVGAALLFRVPSLALPTFLAGWVFSTVVLTRGGPPLGRVLSRAFLLGAAYWLALIPVVLYAASTLGPLDPSLGGVRGWMMVGSLSAYASVGFAILAVLCLAAYATLATGRLLRRRVHAPGRFRARSANAP